METSYPAQLVGWVVWGKVRSLPWWPGQVMHPSKGPPEVRKMAAMKSNAGKLLVMFLGDNKYAFLTRDSIVDFAEYKERHSSTNYASKFWKLGLEEAEELLARRSGLNPATDHEPVNFAARKYNFSLLAKAWAGEAQGSKHAGGSGRAPERSKTTISHPEFVKETSPFLSAEHRKLNPSGVSGRESGQSLRAQAPGVMLEWNRYLPLVAATRKGAQTSTSDVTLRLVRRLGRGEELPEGLLDDHGLQLLHSLCLQRRLQTVDVVARLASRGPATGGGHGCRSKAARGSKADSDNAGLGGLGGPRSVLVQQVFVVVNAAAIPMPGAVWDALRAAQFEAASLKSDRQTRCGGVPAGASVACDILTGDSAGCSEVAAKAAVTDPGSGAPPPATAGSLEVPQLAMVQSIHAQQSIDVDVVLKVNGKFVPHLSRGRIGWRDAPSCGGSSAQGVTVQGIQPVEESALASKLVDDPPRPPALPTSTTPMASAPTAATGFWPEGVLDGPPPPSKPQLKQVPHSVVKAPTAGPAEAATAAGAALSQLSLSLDVVASPGSVISCPCPQAPPQSASPPGTSAGPYGPARLSSKTTISTVAATSGTLPSNTPPLVLVITAPASTGTGTPSFYAPSSPLLAATPQLGTATTAAIVSPEATPGTPHSAAQPPIAALDLSLGLVPWLGCEIRITSWTVVGPHLLLITISADRKRDGGPGGIKREARLLLTEAKERRATSPEAPGAFNEEEGKAVEGPKLKRRLRSAAAASSPAVGLATRAVDCSAAMESAHRQGGGKASQPPEWPAVQAGPQQQQQTFKPQPQAGASVGGSQSADGQPSILVSGPAAAALMRSRMMQQKRSASAAEAASTDAAARAALPGANGAPDGLSPLTGGEAAKTSSSTGCGTGGTSDSRAAKKVKLVRFPPAAASSAPLAGTAAAGNGAAASTLPQTSSGGVVLAAGTAPSAGPVQAAENSVTRRRVPYSQQLVMGGNGGADDGMEESGQQRALRVGGYGNVYGLGGNTGTGVGGTCANGFSGYDQDWDTWYPPWLPQPAQKGPFITVSHQLRNNQHQQNQIHQNPIQTQHHYKSSARSGVASTAPHAPQPNHFRQAKYPHSYTHHQQLQQQASAPHQQPSGARGSPRNNNSGRPVHHRSSGYGGWNLQDEQPYTERRMDYYTGCGRESDYPAGVVVAVPGWLHQPPATAAYYGTVSHVTANGSSGINDPLAGGCGGASCGRILLDIRVGDEGDSVACPVDPLPNYDIDAAIAITVHLAPTEAPAAVTPSAATTSPTPMLHHTPHHHGALYHASAAAHSQPIQVEDAVNHSNPFGRLMTAADQGLATTAVILTDLHMCVCEMKGSSGLGAGSPAESAGATTAGAVGVAGAGITATSTKRTGSAAAAATATAAPVVMNELMMPDKGLAIMPDANARERVAAAAPQADMRPAPTSLSCVAPYEENAVRLRRECGLLRDQVKPRRAPGSLIPLPEQRLAYMELVVQVSERILTLALQLPALSGPAKITFIQFSRTLMLEAAAYGRAAAAATQQQLEQPAWSTAAAVSAAPVAAAGAISSAPLDAGRVHQGGNCQSVSGAVASGRSLAVAQVAAELVRSVTAPCLPLHLEDRWAFINLAAELLRP